MPHKQRTTSQTKEMASETWICIKCSKKFTEPESKLLECQRCKDHYCIKCLGKTKAEYDILSKSDTMWFCITCRKIIEEHIVMDLKIEDRCNQIMKDYEDRITQLETTMVEKCDESRVREIIKDELGKVENNEDTVDGVTQNNSAKTAKKETVTTVIDEMNERKEVKRKQLNNFWI